MLGVRFPLDRPERLIGERRQQRATQRLKLPDIAIMHERKFVEHKWMAVVFTYGHARRHRAHMSKHALAARHPAQVN